MMTWYWKLQFLLTVELVVGYSTDSYFSVVEPLAVVVSAGVVKVTAPTPAATAIESCCADDLGGSGIGVRPVINEVISLSTKSVPIKIIN